MRGMAVPTGGTAIPLICQDRHSADREDGPDASTEDGLNAFRTRN